MRLDCHKVHTVTLLMNAKVRNHWINDPLLHVRLARSPRPHHRNTHSHSHSHSH